MIYIFTSLARLPWRQSIFRELCTKEIPLLSVLYIFVDEKRDTCKLHWADGSNCAARGWNKNMHINWSTFLCSFYNPSMPNARRFSFYWRSIHSIMYPSYCCIPTVFKSMSSTTMRAKSSLMRVRRQDWEKSWKLLKVCAFAKNYKWFSCLIVPLAIF